MTLLDRIRTRLRNYQTAHNNAVHARLSAVTGYDHAQVEYITKMAEASEQKAEYNIWKTKYEDLPTALKNSLTSERDYLRRTEYVERDIRHKERLHDRKHRDLNMSQLNRENNSVLVRLHRSPSRKHYNAMVLHCKELCRYYTWMTEFYVLESEYYKWLVETATAKDKKSA